MARSRVAMLESANAGKSPGEHASHHPLPLLRGRRERRRLARPRLRLPRADADAGSRRQDRPRRDGAGRRRRHDGLSGPRLPEPEATRADDAERLRVRRRRGRALRGRPEGRGKDLRGAEGPVLRRPSLRSRGSRGPPVVLRPARARRGARPDDAPVSRIPGEFAPPTRLLLGPGPSEVHPRVLRAMAAPLLGHLDPAFIAMMEDVKTMLRTVFASANPLTFPISGTGSAGMEACVVNLVEPGDEVVVGVNGVFGTRMADVGGGAGGRVLRVEAPWGRVVRAEQVEAALRNSSRPKLVALVHAETSTGAWQPLADAARLAHAHGALFLADCVTSLGGAPVEIDAWGVDAAYSGTQKCLSCPPGLAPVTFGPRAIEVMERRTTKVRSWYLDVTLLRQYWGEERVYHHTAPISMNYALREALRLVLEEGLEVRFARHRRNH